MKPPRLLQRFLTWAAEDPDYRKRYEAQRIETERRINESIRKYRRRLPDLIAFEKRLEARRPRAILKAKGTVVRKDGSEN